MDIEFHPGYMDMYFAKIHDGEKAPLLGGWRGPLFLQCILFAVGSAGGPLMVQSFGPLNAPLMVLFNKTSVEMLHVNDGGVFMLSLATWISLLGTVISIGFVIPLMDFRGRRFVCVYFKFGAGFVGTGLIVAAWCLQNGFLFLFGFACCAVTSAFSMLADPLYMTELAPPEHKGFFAAAILSISGVITNIISLILARQDVFGTPEKWVWIAVIGMAMNFVVPLVGASLPNKTQSSTKSQSLHQFYSSHFEKVLNLFAPEFGLRKKIFLLGVLNCFLLGNITLMEAEFPIPLYVKQGFGVDEILTMKLLVFIIVGPFVAWLGPVLIDKLRSSTIVLALLLILLMKSALHVMNFRLQLAVLGNLSRLDRGSGYLNTVLLRVVQGGGFISLTILTMDAIMPKEFAVISSQVALIGSVGVLAILASISPFALQNFLAIFMLAIGVLSTVFAAVVLYLFKGVYKSVSINLADVQSTGLIFNIKNLYLFLKLVIKDTEKEPLLQYYEPPPKYSAKESRG